MKFMQIIAAALLAAGAGGASALTIADSDFDSGAQGWQALNGAANFLWQSDGGYIQASDVNGQELWFFSAPAAYRGDISAAYGGALTYSLRTSGPAPALQTPYANVQILGTNGVLLTYGGNIQPGSDWATYTVPLLADGAWTVGSLSGPAATAQQMLSVLSGVRAFRIRGDYQQAIETTGLDSVSLTTAAVPEPGAGAMALAGLAVVFVLWRRR